MGEFIKSFKELRVYQEDFSAAMEIFEITKSFPVEERYSLTDQIRRSSRSVCHNIGEAWRRRRYKKSFISKLNDSETESCETQISLEFALQCKYIDIEVKERLYDKYEKKFLQLFLMAQYPEKWILKEK